MGAIMTHKNSGISDSQRNILETISTYISQKGFPPTMQELADILGIKASSVYEQLNRLEKKGYIRRKKRAARSIEIIKNKPEMETQNGVRLIRIPVLGTIAAGEPIFAFEREGEEIFVDESSIGSGRFFALKVKGNSMVDAEIFDGDLVIVRRQPVAENGEIVAALIDDEATVKKLRMNNGEVFLDPQNKTFSPIEVTYRDDFRILGKVVTTVKIS
jgi:repressor LexA